MTSPLQEQDGAWSMRRLGALGCLANAIRMSWSESQPWQNIALFIGAALILLGLTTISDIKGLADRLTGVGKMIDQSPDTGKMVEPTGPEGN